MILIVRGRDTHTIRLQQSLYLLGKTCKVITKPEDIDNTRYELVFIDPSFDFDISNKIKSERIVFYDCEDSPTDFYPGTAWNTIKCDTYVKMNYDINDTLDIHKVAFPLPIYNVLSIMAKWCRDIPENYKGFIPTFIGSPTFIGRYKTPEKVQYKNKKDIKVLSDNGMYNQRYDWLQSIRDNYKSKTFLGIVFREGNNLSKEFQKTHFGDVDRFTTNPISSQDLLLITALNRVGLSPSGHERLSWRIWDIMATGAILFVTDFNSQRSMYMPLEYVLIKDEEDIGTILSSYSNTDLLDLHKAAKKNQEFMASLTPDKIWNDFIESIK